MNAVCIILTLAFWASIFVRVRRLARFIVFMLALVVGTFFSIGGGLSYWWDRSMQPGKASAIMFVCGLLILASQLPVLILSLSTTLPSTGDIDGPE